MLFKSELSLFYQTNDLCQTAVAAKAVKEVDYHHDHAMLWVLRLGDGTEESHERIQTAFDAEWAYVDELFDVSYVDPRLVEQGVAVDPTDLRDSFEQRIADVLVQATLRLPSTTPAPGGGRGGQPGLRQPDRGSRPARR